MESKNIITTQIQGISAETLLKEFDDLRSQIKTLQSQPTSPVERLITRDETAKLLGVSLVTLHSWIKSGILVAYRIGNKVRFKENEVYDSLQKISSRK